VYGQWELAEAFRRGLGVEVNMAVARKYLRKAAAQGHATAAAVLKEMRRCVVCAADAAPRACTHCREARYCGRECQAVRPAAYFGAEALGRRAGPTPPQLPPGARRREPPPRRRLSRAFAKMMARCKQCAQ
jgi:hypothetical protein